MRCKPRFIHEEDEVCTHPSVSYCDCALASLLASRYPANRSFKRCCNILSFATSIRIFCFTSPSASAINLSVASTISSYVASSGIPSCRWSVARSCSSRRASRSCSFRTFHGSCWKGLAKAAEAARRGARCALVKSKGVTKAEPR